MRALHLGNQLRLVEEYPCPLPAQGEALVRISLAGICATDLAMVRGYRSFQGVLGHEFVGVVEKAADPTWLNRRVVGEINCGCGHCRFCRGGQP
ncbi:MAG: alcohol dehydrogenase catalytic domain-containing protein, partial [Magnetococcales bacterium]|nr:alcohol dehydrogenase catalytic domain-containing protein [Magnetococcales bacterium]